MGVLEQIKNLNKEGLRDEEISTRLQEQGISPSAINDAFNQLKIKNAVDTESYLSSPPQNTEKMQESSEQYYTPRTRDVEEPSEQGDYYAPQNSEMDSMESYPGSQGQIQQEYYPQQEYNQEEGYQPSQGSDTDTMIEIAEQVFLEKTKRIQKQLDTLSEFATLAESKIENNSERIKRIEKIMDNLQIKILEKVGSYGENLESVKKEMSMMQDSFSKVLPKLAEAHSRSEHEHHKTHEKK